MKMMINFPNLSLIRISPVVATLVLVFILGLIGCTASSKPKDPVSPYDVEQFFNVIRGSNPVSTVYDVSFNNDDVNEEPVILITATNTATEPLSLRVNLNQQEGVFTSDPEVIQIVAPNAVAGHQETIRIMVKSGSRQAAPYTVKVVIKAALIENWLTDANIASYITADFADFDEAQRARILLGSDNSLSVIGLTNVYNGADASISIAVPTGFTVIPNIITLPDPDGAGTEANTITPSAESFSIFETDRPANSQTYTLNPIDLILNDYTQKLLTRIEISNPPDAFNLSIDRTDTNAPVIILRVTEANTVAEPLSLTVNINQEQGILTTSPESFSVTAPAAISPHEETIDIMATFGSAEPLPYSVKVIMRGAPISAWLTEADVDAYITASLASQEASVSLVGYNRLSLTGITNRVNGNPGSIEFALPRGFIAEPISVRLVDPDGEGTDALTAILPEATFTISESAHPTNSKMYTVLLALEAYVSAFEAPNISASFDGYTTTEDDIEIRGNTIFISGFTNIPSENATGTVTITPPDGYSFLNSEDENITFVEPPGTNARDYIIATGIVIKDASGVPSIRHEVVVRFAELIVFNPENRDHINVFIRSDSQPVERSTFTLIPSQEGANPIILLTGLTNSGLDANDAIVPNKWVVAVTNVEGGFSATSGEIKSINDPVGIATTIVDYGTITIKNINSASDPSDDEVLIYELRLIFSGSIGIANNLNLRLTGNDFRGGSVDISYVSESEHIIILSTAPCNSLGEVVATIVDNEGFSINEYSLRGTFRRYYDRDKIWAGNRLLPGDPVSDTGLAVTNNQRFEIIDESIDLFTIVVGTFDFSFVYPACLAEHLGYAKTGNNAGSAYEISKPEHLEAVAYLVNQSNDTYADKYYKVVTDIDFASVSGFPWSQEAGGLGMTPIGLPLSSSSDEPDNGFSGTFDCDGNTIANLFINRRYRLGRWYVPFTGFIGYASNATIKNCTLRDAVVVGNDITGSLIGRSEASTVTNSHVTGLVNGGGFHSVGGLVGVNIGSSTIDGSSSTANIEGNGQNFGGLVGDNKDSTVENSYATGNVQGGFSVGGLIGDNNGRGRSGPSIVRNSYATGNVTIIGNRGLSSSYYAGGLVGRHDYGSIVKSYATGSVTGTSYVGGLVGYVTYYGYVETSYATGSVTGNLYVGGLAGQQYQGSIVKSYASGAVTGTNHVGGLIGLTTQEGNIKDTYATGNVTGNSNVGGLIGVRRFVHSNRSYSELKNSYSIGNVSGNHYVGLFIGKNIEYQTFRNPSIDRAAIIHEGLAYINYFNADSQFIIGGIDIETVKGVGSDILGGPAWPITVTPNLTGLSTSDLQVLQSRHRYRGWETASWLFEAGQYPRLKTVACANHQYQISLPFTCEDLQ